MTRGDYYIHGKKVKLIREFTYNESTYAVCDDGDGWFEVHHVNNLKKLEDTYQYQEEQRLKTRIQDLKDKESSLIEGVKERAIKSLTTRMKLNLVFSDGAKNLGAVGIAMIEELEKLIRKEKV